MKWFSTKEYLPPNGVDLLLRIERRPEHDYIYERYIIASLEHYTDDIQNTARWELSNGAYMDISMAEYRVTHFALIDPVEIRSN